MIHQIYSSSVTFFHCRTSIILSSTLIPIRKIIDENWQTGVVLLYVLLCWAVFQTIELLNSCEVHHMFLFLLLLISIPFWGFAEDCLKLTMVTHSWLHSDAEDEEQPRRLLNHLISEVKVKNQSSHLQLCILVTFNNIFLFVHFWIKVFCHFTKPLLLSPLFSLVECCDEWFLWQEVLFR